MIAQLLDRCLRQAQQARPRSPHEPRDLTGLVRAFQRQVAALNATPRLMATCEDLRWVLAPSTAAVATSLDLILDCVGLDLGLWEWCAMFGVPNTTPGPAVGNVVIFLSDSGHLLVM